MVEFATWSSGWINFDARLEPGVEYVLDIRHLDQRTLPEIMARWCGHENVRSLDFTKKEPCALTLYDSSAYDNSTDAFVPNLAGRKSR
jgi:hypothetical protein